MATTHLGPLLFSSLLIMLMAIFGKTDAQVGVCYGMDGNNLPSPQEVVAMYKQYGIQRMRIYEPNQATLQALRGSNIELILDLPNVNLQDIASSQANANAWVQNNVMNYSDVIFKYISVGNKVQPSSPYAQYLVPAMQNIISAINSAGLASQIKVSTTVGTEALGISYPPSLGSFAPNYLAFLSIINQVLVNNVSPFLAQLHTYLRRHASINIDISLDYALFTSPGVVYLDGSLRYQNQFDETLDALYSALEKTGGGSLNVVISETGWPSAGGIDATIDNARTYITNLVQHVKGGTPKRPGKAIETYLFAMYDEDMKPNEYERNWGLFLPDKQPKYQINFS